MGGFGSDGNIIRGRAVAPVRIFRRSAKIAIMSGAKEFIIGEAGRGRGANLRLTKLQAAAPLKVAITAKLPSFMCEALPTLSPISDI